MSSSANLYETLGINQDATPDEIRKAYRKHALKTHPDRLPQGATPEQKTAATERFREISNAYEVLNDPQNREQYDRHGVWPPPTAPNQPSGGFGSRSSGQFNNDPFSHPFFSAPFGPPHAGHFGFTDPFVLFRSLFGDDFHRVFGEDPFFNQSFPPRAQPFASSSRDPFGMRDSFGGSSFGFGSNFPFGRSLLADFGGPNQGFGSSSSRVFSSVQQSMGSGGQWVSQSSTTRTINGRTENITTKRDAQGNEHITYSSPEGVRHTINGVEQPSQAQRTINAAPSSSRSTGPPAVAAPPAPAPPVNYHTRPSQDYERPVYPHEHYSSSRHSRHHPYESPPVIPVSRHSSTSAHSRHRNDDDQEDHDRRRSRHKHKEDHANADPSGKRRHPGGWLKALTSPFKLRRHHSE